MAAPRTHTLTAVSLIDRWDGSRCVGPKQLPLPLSPSSSSPESRGWYSFNNFLLSICCRKGDPFQGLRVGSCLTLGNELSEETCADKAGDFIGRGRPGGEQEGKGTQENCSATWLAVSGFMVMGLVSGLSLANHSDSRSFLVVHTSLSQDGFQRGGFWENIWTGISCLLLTFPEFF